MKLFKRSVFSFLIALLVFVGLGSSTIIVQAVDNTTKITILHTNDTHARVIEGDYDGMGFAKIASLVKQLKSENPHTLLLDAGDTFHGTPFATLERGESIAKIFNLLHYDALAAGNHDFNYGYKRLLELKDIVDFPILSANVRNKETNERLLTPYILKEVDGVTLGIFGLTTPETHYKTNPKNVEGLIFTDPVKEAREMVRTLKAKGVDMIIAVTHLGVDESSTDTSIKVAKGAPEIDLIVDGHSHTTMVKGKQIGEDTLIVSAGEHTKNLGVVDLTFDSNKQLISKKAKLISKEEAKNIKADAEMESLINGIEEKQVEIKSEQVGQSNIRLEGEREQVRTRETNLGNLIADALLEETGADIAITNGGGIRASIQKGDITVGDIIDVSPFGNYGVTMKMTGATIKQALEHGVSDYPYPKGGFPQVGGMSFTLVPQAPKGKRVKNLKVNGTPIDLKKEYIVATNDFLASGGDDYLMFKEAPLVNEYEALEEIMKNYIKAHSPIQLTVQDRIQVFFPFKDITRKHWAFENVRDLYDHNIVNGIAADTFGPNDSLTRVQYASILVRGIGLNKTKETPFTDIGHIRPDIKEEIEAAYAAGIIKGKNKTTFAPTEKITREEMTLMVKRAYEQLVKESVSITKEVPFKDIKNLNEESQEAIALLYELDYINGFSLKEFKPQEDTTRAQGAKVLNLFFKSTLTKW